MELLISQTQDPIDNTPEFNRNSFISYTGRDPNQRAFAITYQGADELRKRGARATMQVIHLPQALTCVGECGCGCGRGRVCVFLLLARARGEGGEGMSVCMVWCAASLLLCVDRAWLCVNMRVSRLGVLEYKGCACISRNVGCLCERFGMAFTLDFQVIGHYHVGIPRLLAVHHAVQVADLLHKHDEENAVLGRTGSALGRSPLGGRSNGSTFTGAMSMEKPSSPADARCGIASRINGLLILAIL